MINNLHAATFWGTATVVGQRGDVDDFGDFDATTIDCTDCRFTS